MNNHQTESEILKGKIKQSEEEHQEFKPCYLKCKGCVYFKPINGTKESKFGMACHFSLVEGELRGPLPNECNRRKTKRKAKKYIPTFN